MGVDKKLAAEAADSEETGFVLEDEGGVSSAELIRVGHEASAAPEFIAEPFAKEDDAPETLPAEATGLNAKTTGDAEDGAETELSPVFRELATPRLPRLRRDDRARLQIQSPNRLYFYWSMRANPWQTLNRALGASTANYTLALRLVDIRRDAEELHPIDAEGNWWFSVESGGESRAEIGFYAPNRPFVRVLYSNTVNTPRKSPSPRAASEADWRIPAQKFAQVLDVAGFRQDAFDVAIAGDNIEQAERSSYAAFARLTGNPAADLEGLDADDVRYALTLLAAGATLEDLRFRIGERLFAVLQSAIDNISRENALAALKAEFDIDEEELIAEEYEETGPAVFGSSLVNFPKRLRTRPRGFDRLDRLGPISSASNL